MEGNTPTNIVLGQSILTTWAQLECFRTPMVCEVLLNYNKALSHWHARMTRFYFTPFHARLYLVNICKANFIRHTSQALYLYEYVPSI